MIVFERGIFFDRTSSFLYSRRRGNFIGELQSDGIATYKSNMEKMKRKSRRKNLYDIIQIFLLTSVILTCTVPLSLWKSTYWLETSSSLLSFIVSGVRFVATSPRQCGPFYVRDYFPHFCNFSQRSFFCSIIKLFFSFQHTLWSCWRALNFTWIFSNSFKKISILVRIIKSRSEKVN